MYPAHSSGQGEPSVKTHRSPLSAEFWKHYVLTGGTQRRTLLRHQSEENENINRTHNQLILQSHSMHGLIFYYLVRKTMFLILRISRVDHQLRRIICYLVVKGA